MKRVQANFARRRVPGRTGWMVLAALGVAALGAAGLVAHRMDELAQQRASLEGAAAARTAAAVVPVKQAPPPAYEQSARAMLVERQLAWPDVLTALEATAIVGVTPTSVDMSASDGVASVEVSFADYARLLEYVQALNAGEGGLRWTLKQAQAQAQPAGVQTAVLQTEPITR